MVRFVTDGPPTHAPPLKGEGSIRQNRVASGRADAYLAPMSKHETIIANSDYETVQAAIAYLSETLPDEIDLPRFARALGLTERQLTDLFRRWCGLSPKSFAQCVALNHAKKLLAESGYKGEPVVCIVAQDMAATKSMGDVTAELLKSIGMKVDFVATDWGTVGARRAQKTPPDQGGWSMFHTWHAGADCVNPASYTAIRANGDKAWFGWPDVPAVETEVTNWFAAKDIAEEKAALGRLNKAAVENVVYAPTGFYLNYQAWRKNVTGVVSGPLPFFWGVSKA